MNRMVGRHNRILAVCLAIAVMGGAPLIAFCQEAVAMTYEPPEAVSLGEPVIIRVTATNLTHSAVEVDFGWGAVGNFQFAVRLNGRSVAVVTPPRPRGLVALGAYELRAGQSRAQAIVLTSWFTFPSEGVYDITVQFGGPVRAARGTIAAIPRDGPVVIQVLPRDARRLQGRLAALVQSAQSRTGDWSVAADALFSIRDSLAVPYFMQLAADTAFGVSAVRGLSKIEGPEARNAIEELARNGAPEVASAARSALAGF